MRPDPVRTALASVGVLLAVAAVTSGCGSAPPKSPPTGVDELTIPTPSPDPADFVARIDNPWLPLEPGNTWTYEISDESETQTETLSVLDRTKVVAGVTTTVVHDVIKGPDGAITEETYDWYAQDTAGNVWYFGEDTKEYDDQGAADRSGSWEAGVGGAMAGVAMLASPRVGDGYQQEHLAGVAEDQATVLATNEQTSVPYGEYNGLLMTEDSTPLEPGVVERKYYAKGVGTVREQDVQGGYEQVVLVSFTQR
jgi:hypothetical protein